MSNARELAELGGSYGSGGFVGMKNRIINGAMMIDQRNAGASVTPNFSYTLDRWYGLNTQTGKFSVQQNANAVTPPAGFANYLGVVSASAYSVVSGDTFAILQKVEGFNFVDFAYGTASAQTATLSFWVRSSLTGTFGGSLQNSAANRSYPFTYTINSANTWEYKTVTIAGDQSGTWVGGTNGVGAVLSFGLGCGSGFSGSAGAWGSGNYNSATGATSVVGTNGATFYITGVQLEKGSTATSFDFRSYGTELALCQRYYQRISNADGGIYTNLGSGVANSATSGWFTYPLKVKMRSAPALSTSGTAVDYQILLPSGATTASSVPLIDSNNTSTDIVFYSVSVGSGLTTGQGAFLRANGGGTNAYLGFSSEL